ncbi:MAG: thioredoxin domain-containing protein [Phycisphaerales bacterium]|nr:thioredoxin domain-containing protein [Phycisphaerales bacterium]
MSTSRPANAPIDTPGTGERRESGNRLSRESSPYLLQHAQNPVDWWAWGPEAFAEARRRQVPIFLSVGYSTCYWCHVMERESFESPSIAALMNERFVCVKVDREERPDVDNLYMTATQVFSGRGGWPMSVFLEPEQLRPFWCGTYFPAEAAPGMHVPAFPQVLEGLSGAWTNQREGVIQQAESLAGAVREHLSGLGKPVPVGHRDVERTADRLLRAFDQVHGAFGGAPKFPQTSYTEFLLEARRQAADKATRDALDRAIQGTLDAMAVGGIRDHVGGGFHRYAVDATWTVPHFEKMLYDQALLALLYTRAATVYDDAEYKRVVRETLEYVLREMTDTLGGFFSAQDAEVGGREGQNYLWTPTQLAETLDPGDAEFAASVYGLEKGPNFRDPHHPQEPASNVLRLEARPTAIAGRMNLSRDEFLMKLAGINRRLYAERTKRAQPRKDDKTIAEWNGMMIAAFAEAAVLFKDQRYFAAAERAAAFVLERMLDRDGRLARSWRGGRTAGAGVLDDSAMLIAGLIALHRAAVARTGRPGPTPYLESAVRLYEQAVRDFRAEDMGYFDTRAGQEDLFVRSRTTYDGATPCGSSVMLHNLLDLAEATGEPSYLDRAVSLLRTLSGAISRDSLATVNSTRGLLRLLRTERSKRDTETFAPAGAGEEPTPAGGLPVEIYAETDRVRVSQGEPAELTLLVHVAEGYHVTSANSQAGASGDDLGLVGFRVFAIGGEGIEAYADYPLGEEIGVYGSRFLAYSGQFELKVAIEQTGPISGRPRLAITYQACTDTECQLPRTVELDVGIEGK